jgi:hypothetical protein
MSNILSRCVHFNQISMDITMQYKPAPTTKDTCSGEAKDAVRPALSSNKMSAGRCSPLYDKSSRARLSVLIINCITPIYCCLYMHVLIFIHKTCLQHCQKFLFSICNVESVWGWLISNWDLSPTFKLAYLCGKSSPSGDFFLFCSPKDGLSPCIAWYKNYCILVGKKIQAKSPTFTPLRYIQIAQLIHATVDESSKFTSKTRVFPKSISVNFEFPSTVVWIFLFFWYVEDQAGLRASALR